MARSGTRQGYFARPSGRNHCEHYHMQAVSIAGIRCLKAEVTMSVAIYIKSDTKIEAAGIQQNLDRNRD